MAAEEPYLSDFGLATVTSDPGGPTLTEVRRAELHGAGTGDGADEARDDGRRSVRPWRDPVQTLRQVAEVRCGADAAGGPEDGLPDKGLAHQITDQMLVLLPVSLLL
jgi:hypothetical protein